MLSYDPLHPIQSGIIQLVGKEPGIEVPTILAKLKTEFGVMVSKQNLYKIIGKLIDHQVLVKNRQAVTLHQPWLENMYTFISNAKEVYQNKEYIQDFQLEEGEQKVFMADSLALLDGTWGHIMGSVCDIAHSHHYFVYHPHPYYRFGMADIERRYWQSISDKGIAIHLLYGNKTYLDMYSSQATPMPGTQDVLTDTPPFPKEGYFLNVYDDYITEVYITDEIASRFKYFYDQVTDISQFDIEHFNDIFRMKAQTKFIFRRSKKDAELLKEKFRKYFSI